MYINGESFECMADVDYNVAVTNEGDLIEDTNDIFIEPENNKVSGMMHSATTEETIFYPTVAGERGIYAQWPKKVFLLNNN